MIVPDELPAVSSQGTEVEKMCTLSLCRDGAIGKMAAETRAAAEELWEVQTFKPIRSNDRLELNTESQLATEHDM